MTTAQGDPYLPYRLVLLTSERVRELSRLRPRRVIADVAACWLAIFAAWTAVALWPHWWVVALAVPVIGIRYYALFIVGHDGMHRRLMAQSHSSDLFADVLLLGPIGAITRLNSTNHLAHHRYLANEEDPDRYKHGCFNKTTKGEYLAFLSGLFSVAAAVRGVFFSRPDPRDAPAAAHYRVRDLLILAGWQAALIGGLTAAIGWWAYPVLWLAPVYVFTYLADLIRAFAEHSHPEPDADADRHRLVTFRSNGLERLFFAPMHMNLHAAHHLWPSIPYYNLPQADGEMRAQPEAGDLVRRGSYVAYLWQYFRALPLSECRPAAARASH